MAHKKIDIDTAKDMYCLQGKNIKDIASLLKIPSKTVDNWKKKHEWDKYMAMGGSLTTYMELYNQFMVQVQEAVNNKSLNNSKVADALLKNAKLLEKLMPDQMMLSNILVLLEDLTDYIAKNIKSNEFKEVWQDNIMAIGEYLRKKYAGRFK